MKAAGSEKTQLRKAQNADSEPVVSGGEISEAEIGRALAVWLGLPTLGILGLLAVSVILRNR